MKKVSSGNRNKTHPPPQKKLEQLELFSKTEVKSFAALQQDAEPENPHQGRLEKQQN
jgi:hypothetical protein